MRARASLRRASTVLVGLLMASAVAAACGGPVPSGFHEYTVFDGLNQPTAVEFSPDGRVFVAEKRGVIRVFDGLDDATPTTVADMRTAVFNGWDRGMLGLALPPSFPEDPSIYVLYAYDGGPGQTAPHWGQPGANEDNCPSPPGWNEDGCVVTARLSRLTLSGNTWTGAETVLVHDWCQQYPSHSIGTMEFGPDGALYVSGGDGASFTFTDYGQDGAPRNPCGDPPAGVGGAQVPATAEGGALRAQDVRTLGDPTGFNGAIIRIDPQTGAALPDNPLASSPNVGARSIVAHGLRNPFRFTLRPGTDELWIADVGYNTWEEIDRSVGDDAVVDNFGWPCYEGNGRNGAYDAANIGMCESLYAAGPSAVVAPHFSYRHGTAVTPDEHCSLDDGSSISGMAFAPPDTEYPAAYDGALFFADSSRQCIWVMKAGADGLPDPANVATFVAPAARPVELEAGPHGELWYVDLEGGSIRRIGFSGSNHPPAPAVTATPSEGDPPLTVTFDASGSTDPDPGDTLTYTWDLDGDGLFDDGAGPTLTHTFTENGLVVARVKVSDAAGGSDIGRVAVTVGDPGTPVAVIDEPSADVLVAAVGDTVDFSGWAAAPDGTLLPPEALTWTVDLLHCPSGGCHRHAGVYSATGVLSGSFVVPDHDVPSAVELHLTARSGSSSTTVTRRIDYRATALTLTSQPAGVTLSVGGVSGVAPFTANMATGGRVTLSAPATVTIDGQPYRLTNWSDGGAASHEVTVPEAATTYTAHYRPE